MAAAIQRWNYLWREPRWVALWAAFFGFMLDAMDVLLYVFALQSIRAEFGWTNAQAGLVSSSTLVFSALGGIVAGLYCDRIGRRRTLIYTILLYSFASGLSSFAAGLLSLMFFRALVGLGLGGEWSAGAVLVAESWPAENRAKAISLMQSGWALGYMLAAGLGALILPRYGWRVLFLVGVLPALMTLFIRRKVEEPELWKKDGPRRSSVAALFRPPLRRGTVLASTVATVVLFAYWGLFTWLPGFLSAPVEQGGAGFNIVKTGGWVIAMQGGAFFGYLTFGWMADRFGRRPAFSFYVAMAGLLVPAYGLVPRWGGEPSGLTVLGMGPLIGFFGTGFFSLFGTILAELYPTEVRGAGQGFAYNFGRGLSALAPFAVGKIADSTGVGPALAINSGFFLLGAVLVFALPETKNTDLSRVR